MKPKAWVGIDPGKTGAAALISEDGIDIIDFSDEDGIAIAIREWDMDYQIELAVLERVGAMPGQGVVSMFSFGTNFGTWRGILAALRIPRIIIPPQRWQAGLISKNDGSDSKSRSLAVARRLFPSIELHLKKHHGRADALLMAHFAKAYSDIHRPF